MRVCRNAARMSETAELSELMQKTRLRIPSRMWRERPKFPIDYIRQHRLAEKSLSFRNFKARK
jgi:hypothetical protein